MPKHLYAIPSGVALPATTGLPEGSPFAKDNGDGTHTLHGLFAGTWVALAGTSTGGGGGGGGGLTLDDNGVPLALYLTPSGELDYRGPLILSDTFSTDGPLPAHPENGTGTYTVVGVGGLPAALKISSGLVQDTTSSNLSTLQVDLGTAAANGYDVEFVAQLWEASNSVRVEVGSGTDHGGGASGAGYGMLITTDDSGNMIVNPISNGIVNPGQTFFGANDLTGDGERFRIRVGLTGDPSDRQVTAAFYVRGQVAFTSSVPYANTGTVLSVALYSNPPGPDDSPNVLSIAAYAANSVAVPKPLDPRWVSAAIAGDPTTSTSVLLRVGAPTPGSGPVTDPFGTVDGAVVSNDPAPVGGLQDPPLVRTIGISGLLHGDHYIGAGYSGANGERSEGLTVAPVTIQAATRPYPPLGVSAGPGPSAGQLTVTWTAPSADNAMGKNNGGSAITNYSVQTQSPKATHSVGSAATSYTITGLTSGQTYRVQVAAVNAQGTSDYTTYVSGVAA